MWILSLKSSIGKARERNSWVWGLCSWQGLLIQPHEQSQWQAAGWYSQLLGTTAAQLEMQKDERKHCLSKLSSICLLTIPVTWMFPPLSSAPSIRLHLVHQSLYNWIPFNYYKATVSCPQILQSYIHILDMIATSAWWICTMSKTSLEYKWTQARQILYKFCAMPWPEVWPMPYYTAFPIS